MRKWFKKHPWATNSSATQHSLPQEGSYTGPNGYNTQSALMRLNKVD